MSWSLEASLKFQPAADMASAAAGDIIIRTLIEDLQGVGVSNVKAEGALAVGSVLLSFDSADNGLLGDSIIVTKQALEDADLDTFHELSWKVVQTLP